MRRFALPALILLALLPTYSGPALRPMLNRPASFEARPVQLLPGATAPMRVGGLRFLAGWELIGRDPAFGSISALSERGGVFTAVSDSGGVMRFALRGGRPVALSFADLPDGPGRGIEKMDRDSESMAVDPATGETWIGFERANAIWRYAPGLDRAMAHVRPKAMRGWAENGGAEAIVRLSSGRFLVFSEYARGKDGAKAALLFPGDPTDPTNRPAGFSYRPPEGGFRITDAAELPDGRIVTLNRRIGMLVNMAAKVAILDPAAIRAGAIVEPKVIATLARPMTIDNFEALAVTREDGRTILWIASDDNFAWFQRTLLMKFALEEEAPRAAPAG